MTDREDHEERLLLAAIFHPTESSPSEAEIFKELRHRSKEVGHNVQRFEKGYRLLDGKTVVAGAREPLTLQELADVMGVRGIVRQEPNWPHRATGPAGFRG